MLSQKTLRAMQQCCSHLARRGANALHSSGRSRLPPRALHTGLPCPGHAPMRWDPTLAGHCRSSRRLRKPHSLVATRASSSSDDSLTSSSLSEIAALDQLIDLLKGANGQQELTKLVAENLLAFDRQFWFRLATRSDGAQSSAERETLTNLANTVMRLVDAIVKRTNTQLSDSSKALQDILAAAADERGEWDLPLSKAQAGAMRAAMDARPEHLNEALLSNAFAWMRKSSEDKLDGMVALLQKVLQLYAAKTLAGGDGGAAAEGSAEAALERLLAADEDEWDALLTQPDVQQVGEEAMLGALRRKMEALVLSLPSGSYAQRVRAEYLKELETRAQAAFRATAPARSGP